NTRDTAPSSAQDTRKLLAAVTLQQLGHKAVVATATESAPRSCDHNPPDAAVACGLFECFGQIPTHVTDERVELLWAVQRYRQDAGILGGEKVFGHVFGALLIL